ncbi:MAG: hypothetical protein LBC55_00545 [Desulfovibrio sp.]|jgi:hypothetical protein|nr:hypothetical protein [Desulfovibrio sp.]
MRPEGRPGELFAAFSRINARAFRDDRLVSCPVLSKSPDNGDVLRHFLAPEPRRPRGPFFLFKTALRYAAANVGHLLFMLCAALFIRLLRFRMPAALRNCFFDASGGRGSAPDPAGGMIPPAPPICEGLVSKVKRSNASFSQASCSSVPDETRTGSIHEARPEPADRALLSFADGDLSGSAGEAANGGGELLILDSFAVLPSLAREGVYRELYLVGLEDAAHAAGREVVTLLRLYGSRDPRALWKALRALARKGNALTEVHLLTCADWARLVLHMLLYPVSLARLVRSLRKPEGELRRRGNDPNLERGASTPFPSPEECIREALIDCAGQCVLIGESRRLAARRLAFLLSSVASAGSTGGKRLPQNPPGCAGQSPDASAASARPARIISWYENQTVNKAFQRGLAQAEKEGARHIRVTGAQLFIWPDNLLNNHADDVETEIGLAPDCVLVNGPYFLPEHSRQHYAVGPALRYGDIFRSVARPAGDAHADKEGPRSPQPSPALVLLSYHPEETRRVLRLLQPAATENPAAFAYRFHPATRIEDFASLLPPGARLAGGPLREALEAAGAVIGAGSGALVEAAAVGVPVLAVEDPSGMPGLGLNYLPPYGKGELWESVRAPEDIAPALACLRACLSDPERPAKVRAFRDMLFCEQTPERIRESFMLG